MNKDLKEVLLIIAIALIGMSIIVFILSRSTMNYADLDEAKANEKKESIKDLLFSNLKNEKTDSTKELFLGFQHGMSKLEFVDYQLKLVKQNKLYLNKDLESGLFGYDLLLKLNKCKSNFHAEFIDNKLDFITINYEDPIESTDYNDPNYDFNKPTIQEQTIEFLTSIYGNPILVAPLLDDEHAVQNETVYHWIKGSKHITYINSSYLDKHIIEFHNSYKEARDIFAKIKEEKRIQKELEQSVQSNGKSSSSDFK